MSEKYDLIVITGPTASGKTGLAAQLAHEISGEIISADSRQIYRGMDLGTGKDLADYQVSGKIIPYHLIDIADPGYKYSVFEFQRDCLQCIEEIKSRHREVILCGGTGMYIDAVVNAYRMPQVPVNEQRREELNQYSDAELIVILSKLKKLHNTSDIDSRKRMIRAIEIEEFQEKNPSVFTDAPAYNSLIFGVRYERDERRKRISERLNSRLKEGMIEEVEGLLNTGVNAEDLIFYGLEYKYLTLFLIGKLSYEEMVQQLTIAIHQFAKRQMTWFRKMEREGNTIHWIDGNLPTDLRLAYIRKFL
jgi:tRNA dimethylallyltransferase